MAAGEERNGFWAEDGASAEEHGMGEPADVFGGREKSRVTGDSAEDAGVFVLDFALDYFLAEGATGLLACG